MDKNRLDDLQKEFYQTIKELVHKRCEKTWDPSKEGLEPFAIFCARKELEAMEQGEACVQQVAQAFQLIIEGLTAAGDEQTLRELMQGLERYQAWMGRLKEESSPANTTEEEPQVMRTLFGLSEEVMEKMYQVGVTAFRQGRLEDASAMMRILLVLDPGFSAIWVALGIVLKAQKRWQESLDFLTMSSQMDQENPIPHLHEAGCYKELGKPQEAQQAIHKALESAAAHPEYRELVAVIKEEQKHL